MLSAMSSTSYQPNPGKRPISEVSPEFPSLPNSLSFSAAQKFAIKSQEALISVQQDISDDAIFPGKSFVFLPFISPHQLQSRFNVSEDNSVLVLARKSYPVLKLQVDSLNNKRFCGIYVR